MKYIFVLILVLLDTLSIWADIAPNPIKEKGISIKAPTEIKMTYEKVTIDLTLDSSFVHCYFELHNEGNAEKIQIGFPFMNTLPYTSTNTNFAPINVYQNGKKIDNIDFWESDWVNKVTNSKSWYYWDTHLEKDETMVEEVSYSLPHGVVKNNLYYKFDYLLSTGSGWKGKIDSAVIIVNLKNFNKELILTALPDNPISSDNQLIWKFYHIEPTTKDDISIKYETKLGQYSKNLKHHPLPITIIDEKIIMSNDVRDPSYYYMDNIKPNSITVFKITRDSTEIKSIFPKNNYSGGLLLLYTDQFVPDRLIGILNSKQVGNHIKKIKHIPLSKFKNYYILEIDGKKIEQEQIPREILNINESKIKRVVLKDVKGNKRDKLSIETNK